MAGCMLFVPPGDQVVLTCPIEDGDGSPDVLIRRVVEVVAALYPVVQPLALYLWLGCHRRGLPYVEPAVLPARPYWSLREAAPPASVPLHPPVGAGVEDAAAPAITPGAVQSWLAKAFDQPPPAA